MLWHDSNYLVRAIKLTAAEQNGGDRERERERERQRERENAGRV